MKEKIQKIQKTQRDPNDSDYEMDENGRLLYWTAVCRGGYCVLNPAEAIIDRSLILGKIGQQNLLPSHLTLRKNDLEMTEICDENGKKIGRKIAPGISGFVYFGTNESKQNRLSDLAISNLNRELTNKNRLYLVSVGEVIDAGWMPVFAPLIDKRYENRNPLHVIICPQSIYKTGVIRDANEEEKIKLCQAFTSWGK